MMGIAVHFQNFANALYMVEACNATACTGSTEANAMNGKLAAIGYFKASNTGPNDSRDNDEWQTHCYDG